MRFDVTGDINFNVYNGILSIPIKQRDRAQELVQQQESKKYPYYVEIDENRPKRSLNANSYAWVLIGKIAKATGIGNSDVYENMLLQYSNKYTHYIMPKEAAAFFIQHCRDNHMYARELNDMQVNGKDGVQMQVFYGSSTFNTKEMSRLIDGIVSEAKELGIETLTPEQIARLKDNWRVKEAQKEQ